MVPFNNEKHNAPGRSSHDRQDVDIMSLEKTQNSSKDMGQPRIDPNFVQDNYKNELNCNNNFSNMDRPAKSSRTSSWLKRFKKKRKVQERKLGERKYLTYIY